MATKVYSFGFRHGLTVDGAAINANSDPAKRKMKIYRGDNLIIDVRGWLKKNPFHDKRLRKLRGTDKAVQDDIKATKGFMDSFKEIFDVVGLHSGPVYIGCTGGHHRSVYITELLGRALNVPIEHLHINTK